jgi:uncharacterized membrane protein YfcA
VSPKFYAVAAVSVAVGAFIQGAIGLGFSLVAVPVIAFLDPELIPVSILMLTIPLSLYVMWREQAAVEWSGVGWITVGRILGTPGGLALLALLLPAQLSALIGIVTIAAALLTLLAPRFDPARTALLTAGLITGVTETATGIGGPPLAIVYQHKAGPVLRSTIAACFLIGQVLSLSALIALGRVSMAHLAAAAALFPALAIGTFASKHAHKGLEGQWLRRCVLAFAVVSGLGLLLSR